MAAGHLVYLAPGWALWRDFAVRSTGFPVEGLQAFGGESEGERLAEVARDPRFREAVAWQSRDALAHAIDKHARGVPEGPSRVRRREEVVASFWQRYCTKNDTIGFFGPLGWGRFSERDPTTVRGGAPEHERVVHLENWAVEAVASAAGVAPLVPMSPFPERALRERLARERPDALQALDRLEAARDAVAAARREDVAGALARLDDVFVEVTGRPAVRCEQDTGGGRTVAYLDCVSDLDLTIGSEVLDELRTTLPALLHASRWWCGRVFAAGSAVLEQVAQGRSGPLGPLMGDLMAAAWGLFEHLPDEQAELQSRWAHAVGDGGSTRLAERAAVAFADAAPAWHWSSYHSADVQIAATDIGALRRGQFLAVLGDFHGGSNPLGQGLFAHRHPESAITERIARDVGPFVHLLPPRRGVVDMTARAYPTFGTDGSIVITAGAEPGPDRTRAIPMRDILLESGEVTDRAGSFRVPLAELLFLPIFIAGVRTFDPFGPHEGRVCLGRTVVRRATWSIPTADIPERADELPAWAQDRGLPRSVFARIAVPLASHERKPMYIDFNSPALRRVLARFISPLRDRPGARFAFTEMLPTPDQCWLQTEHGHHTSELRLVALDTTRVPATPARALRDDAVR